MSTVVYKCKTHNFKVTIKNDNIIETKLVFGRNIPCIIYKKWPIPVGKYGECEIIKEEITN